MRELEEEGWTTAFSDGSGLNDKAAGGFCSNSSRLDKERQPDLEGSGYLGTKSAHFDGEVEGFPWPWKNTPPPILTSWPY